MIRPYNRFYKIIRSWVPVCCALSLGLLILSCTQSPPLLPQEMESIYPDGISGIIERATTLMDSGDYVDAADLLRSTGQQEPSYYRMDEVLYLLGRCNIALGDPVKAARCFNLLRQYFPRVEANYPLLASWESSAEQGVAALKKLQGQENDSGEEPSMTDSNHSGPLVSNSFYETDIRQALMDLSAQTEIAIIPDAMVRGYITLDIIDVPLEQALSLILSPMGYSYRKIENYYIVGAPVADNPSFPLLAQTEAVKPKHLPAAEVPKLIPDYYNNFIKVNEKTNTLVISAPPAIIDRFKEELAAVDHPPQQVLIEALVVEMGDEARRSLGLEWDWSGTKGNDAFKLSKLLPSYSDTSFFLSEMFRTGDHHQGMVFDLRLALQALAIKDQANIRANPRITTSDGQEAAIRIGKEAYYSLLQGSSAYSYVTLEKIATGIMLMITPYVGSEANITADIVIEVSDVTGSGATDLPVTSVRSVETRVQIDNGQTIGIGGLVSENKRETRNRIPFLGDIPILGYLFGNTTTEIEKTEVVVLITPHLLIDPSEFDQL